MTRRVTPFWHKDLAYIFFHIIACGWCNTPKYGLTIPQNQVSDLRVCTLKKPKFIEKTNCWQNQRRRQPKYNANKPTFCLTNASPRPRLRWQTRLWPVVQWVHPLRFDTVIPPLRQYLGMNGVSAMCKIMRTGGSRRSIESIGETYVAVSNISSHVILCRCSSVIRHRRLDLTPPCGNRTPNTIAL